MSNIDLNKIEVAVKDLWIDKKYGKRLADWSNLVPKQAQEYRNEYLGQYKEPEVGVFDSINRGREEEYKQEWEQAIDSAAAELAPLFIEYLSDSYYEDCFQQICSRFEIMTPKRVGVLSVRTAIKAYGSPKAMNKQQLRHYTITYYNPTNNRIFIGPMGLLDEKGECITYVEPGGTLVVLESYAKGGRASVLHTTAPQLEQFPDKVVEELLDLTPISYKEWIKFLPNNQSYCCKAPMLWSDKGQRPQCAKCSASLDILRKR